MKSFHTFKESIIDIPRSTYAPMVFDKEDTSNPVIKPSVIKMIEDQLAEFRERVSCVEIYFNWFYTYTQIQK